MSRVRKIESVAKLPEYARPPRILRVAAYVRVSTDLEEQSTSFEAQRDYYEKKIKENPEWVLAGIYADEGKSGTSYINRAEFNRMMEDCRQGKIDMILDGGMVEVGIESTIVDLTSAIPTILRPGYITKEMLEHVIGPVQIDPAILDRKGAMTGKPKAPGMKYKHYAPKAQLTIVQGQKEKVIDRIYQLSQEQEKAGKKVGIIATDETVKYYKNGVVRSIGSRMEQGSIARGMYKILRDFDHLDVDVIYTESFEGDPMGMAIMNRLNKAAGYSILTAE